MIQEHLRVFSMVQNDFHHLYVFDSVWGDRVYTVYGILLLALLLVLFIAAVVTILFTYRWEPHF